jgi:hypothetical protein
MVDVQTISVALASAGVLAASIYYIWQIRHQTKLRQTDIIVRLFSTYMSDEFRDALAKVWNLKFENYEDYVKKYGFMWTSEDPVPKTVSKVCVFFNGIGVLVRRGLVDVDIVDDLLGTERTWQRLKPIIEGIKKQHNWPEYFKDFEYLYNEVKKRDQKLKKSKA